jgi:hypothetical protein
MQLEVAAEQAEEQAVEDLVLQAAQVVAVGVVMF